MPVIGRGAPSQLVLYHGGSIQGFNTAVYLLPDTETAIIAMQNCSALGDACDWIPQMIMHKLSGSTERIDFLHLATVAARAALSLPAKIEDELEMTREKGTRHLNLETYTGHYWNTLDNFRIDVSVCNGRLYMTFQGIVNETYELRHYHHHSWTWNMSHDETAKQGRYPTRPWISYIVEFDCGENEEAQALLWKYDEEQPEPGVFVLEEGSRRVEDRN